MKTAIVYYSQHHGNTKKLLDALPADVTMIDAASVQEADLTAYDRVGFASGIYGGAFARQVTAFAQRCLPEGMPVFFAATSAMRRESQFKGIRRICEEKNCPVLGAYICFGYNTFGPFKLVGGTSKGHPTREEIDAFADFYRKLG